MAYTCLQNINDTALPQLSETRNARIAFLNHTPVEVIIS